ncbi:MAG: hypothetical protein B7733_09245 [Myxococcales bacterium FL481]|nr:MAG: hypothetical protein B7733_09245 [Myxococcales bacterium FL481]
MADISLLGASAPSCLSAQTAALICRSKRTLAFRRAYQTLPPEPQQWMRRAYRRLFRRDPFHPALCGAMVRDQSARRIAYRIPIAATGYRALASVVYADSAILFTWYWLGDHDAYERRLP